MSHCSWESSSFDEVTCFLLVNGAGAVTCVRRPLKLSKCEYWTKCFLCCNQACCAGWVCTPSGKIDPTDLCCLRQSPDRHQTWHAWSLAFRHTATPMQWDSTQRAYPPRSTSTVILVDSMIIHWYNPCRLNYVCADSSRILGPWWKVSWIYHLESFTITMRVNGLVHRTWQCLVGSATWSYQ